jgi:hypothetical protein
LVIQLLRKLIKDKYEEQGSIAILFFCFIFKIIDK